MPLRLSAVTINIIITTTVLVSAFLCSNLLLLLNSCLSFTNYSPITKDYKDFYELLNIPRDASLELIKKAYRKYCLRIRQETQWISEHYHESARQEFQRVLRAFQVLSDSTLRKIYNAHGEEGVQDYQQEEWWWESIWKQLLNSFNSE